MGYLQMTGGGLPIPIFGAESVVLNRRSTWNQQNPGAQSVYIMKWEGDDPVRYNFDFELVAGITVKTRLELFEHMKTAHAMVAHTLDGDQVKSPPQCRLSIGTGSYIDSIGIVEEMTVIAKPPWDPITFYPTACTFRGTFIIAPGYTESGMFMTETQNELDSNKILNKFYTD